MTRRAGEKRSEKGNYTIAIFLLTVTDPGDLYGKNLTYETIPVELVKKEQKRPEFLQMNPCV
jgi:hypothetical protein